MEGIHSLVLNQQFIDVTNKIPVILRPGYITQEMIEKSILGIKDYRTASGHKIEDKVKSPGDEIYIISLWEK